MAPINSRERIERTFRLEPTDRVACFEQLIYSTVASDIMGRPMHTGGGCLERAYAEAWLEGGQEAWDELSDRVLRDVVDLHREIELDMVRPVAEAGPRPTRKLDDTTYLVDHDDGSTERYVFNGASQTLALHRERPTTVEDVRREVEQLERAIEDSRPPTSAKTLYARYAEALPDVPACASGVTLSIPMRSPYLELCLLEPELIGRYLQARTERIVRSIRHLERAGALVALGGGDLATSKGPVYSPGVFGQLVMPCFRRIVARCQEHGMPYIFRTDGWLWPLMHMLFDELKCAGYGEIDGAAGMDLGRVRRSFPRLVLWGNVPCGTVLLHGSPEEVKAWARQCIRDTDGGRGLILGSSNCLVHGTPAANVLAMLEVAREAG